MKEVRAVVLGVLVLMAIALVWAFLARPGGGFHRVRGFRIEIHGRDGSHREDINLHVPGVFAGRAIRMAAGHLDRESWRECLDDQRVTPREILAAVGEARPGHPGIVERGDARIEVSPENAAIRIVVTDRFDPDRRVELLVPRSVVESLSADRRLSPDAVLREIDQLAPGDLIVVRDGDSEIRITAEK
jgi:hypothetical protein